MAVLRKCVCCGKEYEYCPNCGKSGKPAWMVSFCSEECKELFNLVSAYNMKLIGKAKVQAFVAEHGITNLEKYGSSIRKVLEDVPTPVKEEVHEEVKAVIETPVEVPASAPVVAPVDIPKEEPKTEEVPVEESKEVVENSTIAVEEPKEEKKKSAVRTSIRRRRKLT